jgi:S1-C subfamily serine protease
VITCLIELAERLIREATDRMPQLPIVLGCQFAADASGGPAKIGAVSAGRAAEIAGLKVGDIIEAVNGEAAPSRDRFRELLTKFQPGNDTTELSTYCLRMDHIIDVACMIML